MKKIVFTLALVFIVLHECLGQIANIKFGTNELIESAISDGIYVIRTNYVLKDKKTGNLYGKGGLPYYGSYFSIGYALSSGFLCDEFVVTPWLQDQAYDKYKNDGNYEPVLIDSLYIKKAIGDDGFRVLPLNNVMSGIPDTPWTLLCNQMDNAEVYQVSVKKSGNLSGWIVWLSSDMTVIEPKTQLSLISTRKAIDVDSVKTEIEAPGLATGIVGGLFVVPEIIGVGNVLLSIKGVLKKEGIHWYMYPVSEEWKQVDDKGKVENPVNEEISSDPDNLTPIQPAKDRKKKPKK